MALSPEALKTAKYLVECWDKGIVESYFELIDATAGSSVKNVTLLPGLGVLEEGEFDVPSFASLNEIAFHSDPDLILMTDDSTSNGGQKWDIQLTQNLRDFVNGQLRTDSDVDQVMGSYTLPSCFISYKREDKKFTKRLARILMRILDYSNVWFDEETKVGQRWWNKIVSEIFARDTFVYLLTEAAIKSVYCRAEFTEACRAGCRIIPIQYASYDYPEIITTLQLYDATEDLELENVETITEILASLFDPDVKPLATSSTSIWSNRKVQTTKNRGVKYSVEVPANLEPDDANFQRCNTGILVVEGDSVQIRAKGQVAVDDEKRWSSPNGIPDYYGQRVRYIGGNIYSTTASLVDLTDKSIIGSLFGWIGDEQDNIEKAFYVGANSEFKIPANFQGFLHLAVNDEKGRYGNNEGHYVVDVEIRNP